MSVHLIIGASEPEQCSVVIEPYGVEYVLTGGHHLRLDVDVSDDSPVEVGCSPGCVTLWLPVSVVSVQAANRIGDTVDLGLDVWLEPAPRRRRPGRHRLFLVALIALLASWFGIQKRCE